MKAAFAALCGALLLAAPAWAAIKIKPAPPPPPYAGVYQPQGVDEIGKWREDDESERKLANSPIVIRDEALTAYVKSVLCTAVGMDAYIAKPVDATKLFAAIERFFVRVPTSAAAVG